MTKLKIAGVVAKDAEGQDAATNGKPEYVHNLIAMALYSGRGSADPVKAYELSMRFREGKDLELDTSDLELVRAAVKKSENLFDGAKGQCLLLLADAKE
jgi:hypothetical protein